MAKQFVVTGIGTDVGKTIVSAILAEALHANYWKPVQAGDLDNSDSIKVSRLTENVTVLQEAYTLSQPMSPHAAATIDGVEITANDLEMPITDENLIVEGAGGLMVPINNEGLLFADMIQKWSLPAIIVSRHYLGSINHTLLTVEVLKKRAVTIRGIIFVGDENESTENIISSVTGIPIIARVPLALQVDKEFVINQALKLKELL